MSSSDYNNSSQKTASISSLVLMMFLVFVAVTIYEFLYWASNDWGLFIAQGTSFSSRLSENQIIGNVVALFLYIVVALIVRGVPSRGKIVIPSLVYLIPFFIVAYTASLTGTLIYSLADTYFLPPNATFSYSLDALFFVSFLSLSVVLTIVSLGALYSRQSGKTKIDA